MQPSAGSYLAGSRFSLADIASVPWIIRAPSRAGTDLDAHLNVREWLGRLSKRPSIAAELKVALVAAL